MTEKVTGKKTTKVTNNEKVVKDSSEVVGECCSNGNATTSISMSYCMQVKQYQPLKMDVFVSVPCDNTPEAIKESLAFCKKTCVSEIGHFKKDVDTLKGTK